MLNSPIILSFLIFSCCSTNTTASALAADGSAKVGTKRTIVVQQDFVQAPPFPILDIGLQHMVSELIANGTDIVTVDATSSDRKHDSSSIETGILANTAPTQCAKNSPCADGSCCNSQGQCGFTEYNCKNTGISSCISNCDAKAMCGKYSLNGQQSCPLSLCCSFSGYCGSSELYCNNLDPVTQSKPCQQGFGSCRVVPPPSCGNAVSATPTASNGRRVAYYQASNLRDMPCNRIAPNQINTTGLTHLVFAFASIDPVSFKVIPADARDITLYPQFTALKATGIETWIAVGGFAFNDLGPTHTTWSDLCSAQSSRAAFISSMVEFMERWGFQGIDIDWEFPGISDRGGKEADNWNLVLLVREMRAAFGSRYGISIALPNDFYYLERFDPAAMEPWFSFINFMTYDMHGPWEANRLGAKIRPQTSLADIKDVSVPLWFAGVSPPKINLGMAYYARGYTVADLKCTEIGCPYVSESRPGRCTNSSGVLSLTEIKELIRQRKLTPKFIPDAMIKQITFEDQWIGYDDDETIKLKTKWADQHCLGGVAIWSIDFNSGNGSDSDISHRTTSISIPSMSHIATSASMSTALTNTGLITSKDGTCGGGKSCKGSPFGNCCSSYGFCGSTEAYCMDGCQPSFGTCVSISTRNNVSISGICGGVQSITCQGSKFGDCCSRYGFCGITDEYCESEKGCQCKFGTCR